MYETVNSPAKWLKYLLYAAIAAAINYLLGNLLLGNLSHWLDAAIKGAALYLLFQLSGSNAGYKRAAIFSAVALVINLLGIPALAVIGSICAIVAQYQEYHAHGDLIRHRDSRLAGKWGSLFWIQFAVEMSGGLLISMVVAVMAASGELDTVPIVAIATVATAILSVTMRVLYLVYLNRTIKALENEFVM